MVNLSINGMLIKVPEGTTILEAARQLNFRIPTLCNHDDLRVAGSCRVCVVEHLGAKTLVSACATPVSEGMQILTNSLKVRAARKHVIELLLSEHHADCTKCYKNGICELQNLSNEFCVGDYQLLDLVPTKNYSVDRFSPSIQKDDSKCIRCQRCVRTCEQLQGVNALTVAFKGDRQKISTFGDLSMSEVVCTNCGQCINRCPTGALVERTYLDEVWDAILDPARHTVVQTAPAVRIGLGEELGLEPGRRVTGKMVAALKRLGFDSVLDTDFSADLTIMEEGTELLTRLKQSMVGRDPTVALPMITSCSPGWIKFIEHKFPEYLPNVSTCKSPQQMFGALAKTYYAKVRGLDPKNIVSVSIMPCTAKKFEANRPEMRASGFKDVDFVLTTRELARMIRQAGVEFNKLKDDTFNSIMGKSSGAGVIFGATGGVMEAALRTAYEIVTGREVPFQQLNVTPVRGSEGVRFASVRMEGCREGWEFLEGIELKCAVAHGLVNARTLMNGVRNGELDLHFMEVMACPGGCLGGGGQPIPTNEEIRKKRTEAIYAEDMSMEFRKSHENPEVIALYRDFLGEPLGPRSHELLHTTYRERVRY